MVGVGVVIKRTGSHTTHVYFTAPNTTGLCKKVTARPHGNGDGRSSQRREIKGKSYYATDK